MNYEDWIPKDSDPIKVFSNWYQTSIEHHSFEPTQMTLVTVDEQGWPAARVVLLKSYDPKGLCFYTNYKSDKARELAQVPRAALIFHWEKPEHRQVRIQGEVEKLSRQESEAYFATRPRASQIGAWVSPQSRPLQSRQELEQKVNELEAQFEGGEVPCPEYWGGYRVKPLKIEFWQSGPARLHWRIRFWRNQTSRGNWESQYLAP